MPPLNRGVGALAATAVLVGSLGGCSPSPTASTSPSGGSLRAASAPPIDLSAVPSRTHVDRPNATSAWIGPAGGTLTARAADGTSFELDIPELAVRDATPITMAPIGSVDDLGLSGGLAGAVYLGPAGLKLAAPATLRITTSKSGPPGTRLVGFDVADDGTTDLLPAVSAGGQLTELVFHFSAPGVGFGTSADLQRIFQPRAGGQLSSALSALLAEDVPWGAATMAEAYAGILAIWDNILQPELSTVANDATLLASLADWRQFIFLLNLFAHRGDVTAALADGSVGIADSFPVLLDPRPTFIAGQAIVSRRINEALDGNKTLCTRAHDLGALANVWYWAGLGATYAPGGTWRENAVGCADLAIAVANLPTSLTANGTGTVFLQFEMDFADGTKTNVDVEASLAATRFTFGRTGSADVRERVEAGHTLQEGVSGQAAGPYSLAEHACWSYGGVIRAVCKDFTQTFGASASLPPIPTRPAGTAVSIQGRYVGTATYATGEVQEAFAAIGGSEAQGDIFIRPDKPFSNTLNCHWTLSPGVGDLGGSFGRILPKPCDGRVQLSTADRERMGIEEGFVGGGMLQFVWVDCTIFPAPNPGCQKTATWVLAKVP